MNVRDVFQSVVEVLKFARIGRSNNNDTNIFSFSHRRFAEYFFTLGVINRNDNVDLEAIPNDSQSRDALVLYCQIASDDESKNVGTFVFPNLNKRLK